MWNYVEPGSAKKNAIARPNESSGSTQTRTATETGRWQAGYPWSVTTEQTLGVSTGGYELVGVSLITADQLVHALAREFERQLKAEVSNPENNVVSEKDKNRRQVDAAAVSVVYPDRSGQDAVKVWYGVQEDGGRSWKNPDLEINIRLERAWYEENGHIDLKIEVVSVDFYSYKPIFVGTVLSKVEKKLIEFDKAALDEFVGASEKERIDAIREYHEERHSTARLRSTQQEGGPATKSI